MLCVCRGRLGPAPHRHRSGRRPGAVRALEGPHNHQPRGPSPSVKETAYIWRPSEARSRRERTLDAAPRAAPPCWVQAAQPPGTRTWPLFVGTRCRQQVGDYRGLGLARPYAPIFAETVPNCGRSWPAYGA